MDTLIKLCITFEIFLQLLLKPPPPPATYTMLKLAKKFWMQTSSVVCEVGGKGKGLGKCELTKRLKNANVSQDFCP